MDVITKELNGIQILVPRDKELNLDNSKSLRTAVLSQMHQGSSKFILDFREVETIDAGGIGSLVKILKMLERQDLFVICANTPALLNAFSLTGINNVIKIYDSMQDAIDCMVGK